MEMTTRAVNLGGVELSVRMISSSVDSKVNETNPSNPLKDDMVHTLGELIDAFQNRGNIMVGLQSSQRNVSQ